PKTSMLNLVAAKLGIAIVPERMTTLGGRGIAFLPLEDEDAKSPCALVLPLQPTLLAQAFADLLMPARPAPATPLAADREASSEVPHRQD
ncbi:hypothetical protein, partial [Gulbenkiania mobilis]|uniref:hypothetical protein n=1 Tax=Gulbenkiania mobilis TaxID=397457 RepID=UPI003F6865CB